MFGGSSGCGGSLPAHPRGRPPEGGQEPPGAVEVDHSKGYALAGWRNAHELAFMGAAPGATYCHLVTFGDRVVNCDFEVREGAAKQGAELFDGLPPWRYSGWEFLVLKERGGKQILVQTYFSLI